LSPREHTPGGSSFAMASPILRFLSKVSIDHGRKDRLRIRVSEDLALPIDSDQSSNSSTPIPVISTTTLPSSSLNLEYYANRRSDIPDGVSTIRIDRDRTAIERSSQVSQRAFFFLASHPGDSRADAQRFSRLVEARRKQDLIEALRRIEPRLRDLTVLLQPTGPTVAADIGPGPLVPTSYMGQGFERLLSIIPAFYSRRVGQF